MGFELSWFWFWVILAAFMIIGEIFTSGFFLLPFGVGAAVTVLAVWAGAGPIGQWIVFLVVSIPALFLLKRFANRVNEKAVPIQVASDRAVGKTGVVLETILPHGGGGRVRVGLEEWRAESEAQIEVPEGALIKVLRVDGTHLVVRPEAATGKTEGDQ